MEYFLLIAILLFIVLASALGAFLGVTKGLMKIEEQLRYHDQRLARLEEIDERRRMSE